jgi:hypothetical protein
MTGAKLFDFIKKLSDQTDESKITWESTAAINSFQTAFPLYTVNVSEYTSSSGNDEVDYALTIKDQNGKILEHILDGDLQIAVDNAPRGAAYNLLRRLYHAARRRALGVEAALDSMLTFLGDNDDS